MLEDKKRLDWLGMRGMKWCRKEVEHLLLTCGDFFYRDQ